jgi:hypothetical protein
MRYGSVARKAFKVRWGLHNKGLIQDHHIIPRQHAKHPIVKRFGYDMNASSNLVMLPTERGKEVLRLREGRLVHAGKHTGYNKYVENILNVITTEEELCAFTDFLKVSCRYRPQDIPWR